MDKAIGHQFKVKTVTKHDDGTEFFTIDPVCICHRTEFCSHYLGSIDSWAWPMSCCKPANNCLLPIENELEDLIL